MEIQITVLDHDGQIVIQKFATNFEDAKEAIAIAEKEFEKWENDGGLVGVNKE